MSRLLTALLVAAISALVVYARLPEGPHYLYVLHKLGHPLAFGLIAWLWHAQRGGAPKYLTTLLFAVLLGAATELAQAAIARDARAGDVLRDGLGAAAALSLHAWRTQRGIARGPWRAALAIALLLAVLAPLAWCATAYANRALRFPVLVQPGTPLDRYFVTDDGNIYRLNEPTPDWSGHQTLVVDVGNPNAEPLQLLLRVHDRQHNWQHADRYNRHFELPPRSRQLLRIPLADIAASPRGRQLDLHHVAGVALFVPQALVAKPFMVNSLRLE